MREILAATGNLHKLAEIRAILDPAGIRALGASEVGGIPLVCEDADTFLGNAVKKATEVARAKGQMVFADDSGLIVEALGDEPGVHSARYAGADASDADNVRKLLRCLGRNGCRRARFVCVVAVAAPDGLVGTASGAVGGSICAAPRGRGGFGYDPVFVPDGFDRTFAELEPTTKNRLSHRARALQAALAAGLFAGIPDAPEPNEQRRCECN